MSVSSSKHSTDRFLLLWILDLPDDPQHAISVFRAALSHGIEMLGEVDVYDPPTRIGFRQAKGLPFGAVVTVRIDYSIEEDEQSTLVVRNQVFRMPWLLRPMEMVARPKVIAESRRILGALKRNVESNP